jgi:hypothetical protein
MAESSSSSTNPSPVGEGDSSKSQSTKQWDVDIPLLGSQPSTTPKGSHTESSLLPIQNHPTLQSQLVSSDANELTADEKETVKYEFTFIWDGRLHTAIVYDNSLLSACERVLCQPVHESQIQQSKTGNYFLVDDGGQHWAIKKHPYAPSAVFATPTVEPQVRKKTGPSTADVLSGLV